MASLIETFIETWTERAWNSDVATGERTLDELIRPDCVLQGAGGDIPPLTGPEEYRPYWRHLRDAFPDLRCEVTDTVLGGDGRHGSLMFVLRGTHGGVLLGHEPTGRRVAIEGASHLTVDPEGRLLTARTVFDVAGMLSQLGISVGSVEAAVPKP